MDLEEDHQEALGGWGLRSQGVVDLRPEVGTSERTNQAPLACWESTFWVKLAPRLDGVGETGLWSALPMSAPGRLFF